MSEHNFGEELLDLKVQIAALKADLLFEQERVARLIDRVAVTYRELLNEEEIDKEDYKRYELSASVTEQLAAYVRQQSSRSL